MPDAVGTLIFFVGLGAIVLFALRTTILGRGFWVPLREMFRRADTAQYPEHPQPVQERFHGRHQLNRYDDGLERCIGCELCAWACPADAIYVQGADNTAAARYSPGERYAEDYQINYSRCILCGLCIEACPTRALTMTHDYELSADTRNGLIYTKEMLLAPVSGEAAGTPQLDRDVRERGQNYYGGAAVTPPTLLGGGDFLQATHRPRYRSSDVVPTGAPDAAQEDDA